MSGTTWEKPEAGKSRPAFTLERMKFLIGGVLLLGAVIYLIVSGTISGSQYFITVDELLTDDKYAGETVRISGAVIGDTIQYDSENLILDFSVVNVSGDAEDLALALHEAVNDPNAIRLPVHIEGEVKPDLLQHEAQAILTGALDENGVFHATELLLKCPSRYEEEVPEQVAEAGSEG